MGSGVMAQCTRASTMRTNIRLAKPRSFTQRACQRVCRDAGEQRTHLICMPLAQRRDQGHFVGKVLVQRANADPGMFSHLVGVESPIAIGDQNVSSRVQHGVDGGLCAALPGVFPGGLRGQVSHVRVSARMRVFMR